MIINPTYKYCFFAIPRTASTAISTVLLKHPGSQKLGRKHFSFKEFEEQAIVDQLQYFKFASIRNPLDSVVSAYLKKKNDHNGRFSRGISKKGRPINPASMAEYKFIKDRRATFSEYFLKFYTQPYRRNSHEYTLQHMDAVLRYEQLNKGFANIMDRLGLPGEKIPPINTTAGKEYPFVHYYTPDIIPRAKYVFSMIMDKWGYTFPKEWTRYPAEAG